MGEDEFMKEALALVDQAQSRGIHLRILGALAVYVHSLDNQECKDAFRSLGRFGEGRPIFTDLDMVGYGKQRKEIVRLFESLRFKPDNMVNAFFGNRRQIFYHPRGSYQTDIFLDKLEFSHDVQFGSKPGYGRLELDTPTITLEDIVLEKLQIHRINHKDLIDLIVLFMGHEVSPRRDKNAIDGAYIASVLSDDWGFWYDSVSNLGKVSSLLNELLNSGRLPQTSATTGLARTDELVKILETAPKTDKWQKRAKVGTSKPWFREVEELVR